MGAYYGEEWVQANVDSWLNSEPVPPAPHDFLPGITTADPVAGSYDSTFGVSAYSYSMPVSGPSGADGSVRVRTAVSRDPETGEVTPVSTVVLSTNPVTGTNLDLLRGNVYDPNNVGVGQELNGLDRIAHESSITGQTYGPPAPSGAGSSSGSNGFSQTGGSTGATRSGSDGDGIVGFEASECQVSPLQIDPE